MASNYEVSGTEAYNDDNFTIRLDGNATQKLHLLGRYTFLDYRLQSPSSLGAAGGFGFGPELFAGQSRARNQSLSTGFEYSFSPSLLTDFRFGYYRVSLRVLPNTYGSSPATDAGIPGLNLGDPISSGMPGISIHQPAFQVRSSDIFFGESQTTSKCDCPAIQELDQFQWVSNWAKTKSNHLLKWGADFRRSSARLIDSSPRRAGLLTSLATNTEDAKGNGGLGLATFLLGYVDNFQRTAGTVSDAALHEPRVFFYGQDTWRATSSLTFNYGLRWEIYFPQSVNGRNKGGDLDLSTGKINVAGYPVAIFS